MGHSGIVIVPMTSGRVAVFRPNNRREIVCLFVFYWNFLAF